MSLFLSVVMHGCSCLWFKELFELGVASREPLPCLEAIARFFYRSLQFADKGASAATALLLFDIVQV